MTWILILWFTANGEAIGGPTTQLNELKVSYLGDWSTGSA